MKVTGTRLLSIAKGISKNTQGQGTVEYVLIVTLMALGITAGLRAAALGVENVFNQLATTIATALDNGANGHGQGGGKGQGGGTGSGGGNGGGSGQGGGTGNGGGNGGSGGQGGGTGGGKGH